MSNSRARINGTNVAALDKLLKSRDKQQRAMVMAGWSRQRMRHGQNGGIVALIEYKAAAIS